MYLQEILEVVIGVIFAWMLLSIAVLQIQEIIASYMGKRSSDLEMVLRDMLKDKGKVQEFYNHPLIKSLSKPTKLNTNDEKKAVELENKDVLTLREKRTLSKLRQRPSYIPATNFASAIIDIVIDAGTERSVILREVNEMRPKINQLQEGDRERANTIVQVIRQLGKTAATSKAGSELQKRAREDLTEKVRELGTRFPDLKSCTDPLINTINSDKYDLETLFKSDLVIDQLRVGAQALLMENPTLGRSINSLLEGVEQYAEGTDKVLAAGRKNVEDWFDSTMERLSGWYKRWAQIWAFFIGFAIALIFNVDSLYMAQQFWRNPATRLATATYIQDYVNTEAENANLQDTDLSFVQSEIQQLNFPAGWKLEKLPDCVPTNPQEDKNIFLVLGNKEISATGICNLLSVSSNTFNKYTDLRHYFIVSEEFLGICLKNNGQPLCYKIIGAPRDATSIIFKLIGCLITALAALQGAPFWFDTLKKIVNVRSTGINPDEKTKANASTA